MYQIFLNCMNKLKLIIKKLINIFVSLLYGHFGTGAKICRPVTLMTNRKHIFVGRNVFIRKFARIEPIVQWHDKKFNPKIEIEDNVHIEQNLHLICAEKIFIGNSTLISSFVFITDVNHVFDNISLSVIQQGLAVAPTIIEKNCFIGTGVKIMAGVHIGEHSVIGANAVVTHDIPPYSVVAGIPAKVIKKFNFETNQWEKTK